MAARAPLQTLVAPRPVGQPRRSVQTPEPAIALVQQDLEAAVASVNDGTPWKAGNMLSLAFTASALDQTVPHYLSDSAKGFVIVDKDGTAALYRATVADSKQAKTHVRIIASGAVNATLWVWR